AQMVVAGGDDVLRVRQERVGGPRARVGGTRVSLVGLGGVHHLGGEDVAPADEHVQERVRGRVALDARRETGEQGTGDGSGGQRGRAHASAHRRPVRVRHAARGEALQGRVTVLIGLVAGRAAASGGGGGRVGAEGHRQVERGEGNSGGRAAGQGQV